MLCVLHTVIWIEKLFLWGMGNVERHPERLPRETQTYKVSLNRFWVLIDSQLFGCFGEPEVQIFHENKTPDGKYKNDD